MTGHVVDQHRARAFVRNVRDLHAGLQLQEFHRHLRPGAGAARTVVEVARARLVEGDEVLEGFRRQRRMHGQHIGAGGENRHRRQIAARIRA